MFIQEGRKNPVSGTVVSLPIVFKQPHSREQELPCLLYSVTIDTDSNERLNFEIPYEQYINIGNGDRVTVFEVWTLEKCLYQGEKRIFRQNGYFVETYARKDVEFKTLTAPIHTPSSFDPCPNYQKHYAK